MGSTSGINRVKRGGSWITEPLSLRSAMRPVGSTPATRSATHGFRLSYRQIINPPTNLNTVVSLSIAENQPVGSFIGTFTSTDVDPNPTLSYYLINGAGDTDNSLFALETNGTLKTATTFDYESNASTYSIRVQVRDEFNASMEGNFTVTLENANEAPFNLHNTGPLTMAENAPINTVVGNFNASDPDTGTVLTYSLVNGAGDGDNSLFSMEANMGRLRTAAMFDYENDASSYSIRVAVSDSYGLSTEQSFTVDLTDVIENLAPVDLNSSAELTIMENQPLGTYVGAFVAMDPDGDPLVYSLVSGPGDGNNSSFSLDSNGSLTTALPLDFESGSALSIRVRVADESNASVEENFMVQVVDLDEVAPNLLLNGSSLVTHSVGTTYTDPGATWTDDLDGSGIVLSNSDFNDSQVGTYILDYQFSDSSGNPAVAVSRTVYVLDLTPPVVDLIGDDTIAHEAGTPYLDAGAVWSDNLDGNGTVSAVGQVDQMIPGIYLLRFDWEDQAGNQATTQNRTVIVQDTQAPVISLNGPTSVEVIAGNPYEDAGAFWTDLLDGNGSLLATGSVDTQIPGSYILSYDYLDQAGNPADTVLRTVEVINRNPSSINLSHNRVEENLPAGTLVGFLTAVDPDGNQSIGLEIVPYSELDEFLPFRIDQDGGLRTTMVLDFEQIPSHSLKVRAFDPHGGILEQNFIIEVMDAFLPIVDTIPLQASAGVVSRLSLRGRVLDPGGSSEISEVGFLISRSPILDENDPLLERIPAILEQNGSFNADFFPIDRDAKHYLVAFAVNAEGINYGLEETFIAPDFNHPDPWSMAVENPEAPSWWSSPWFGDYYKTLDSPWLMHQELGWLFPMPGSNGGVWFWHAELGWVWTDSGIYPYLYRNHSMNWLYFYGNSEGTGLLYDYEFENWILLKNNQIPESSFGIRDF